MIDRRAPTADSPRPGFSDLFLRLKPQMGELDRFLRSQLDSFEPEIRSPVEYCLDISGKRIRPALVFFSGWRGADPIEPALVRAAAIVEMVHLATLVHDDIMDAADLRRNRPTVARRYGADVAVLLGDALLAHAVNVAAQFPSTEICRVVSDATRKVCAGEIAQTLRRGDPTITMADYRRIIGLKTAELFRLSCLLGGRLGGFEDGFVDAASAFGQRLGSAYQMYDDLADFFGEEKRIGKTLGTDLSGGKVTLPTLVLLERLPAKERSELLNEIHERRAPALDRRRALMREHGVFSEVVDRVGVELAAGAALLAPWAHLEPTPLLIQLLNLLQDQVDSLSSPSGS
jgi:octaprenyl-diphosphate synthase